MPVQSPLKMKPYCKTKTTFQNKKYANKTTAQMRLFLEMPKAKAPTNSAPRMFKKIPDTLNPKTVTLNKGSRLTMSVNEAEMTPATQAIFIRLKASSDAFGDERMNDVLLHT
jgi:hypothetical protein